MVAANSWLMKAYHVFKKLLDPLDDIFAIIQAGLMKTKDSLPADTLMLLNFIGKILIGAVGLILHTVEFMTAPFTLYQSIKGKKPNILKAAMALYNLILSGTGVGLSAALIAAALGAPVAAMAVAMAPIAIPGLLLCIYVNRLVNKTVSLAITDKNDGEKYHKRNCEVAFSALEVLGTSLIVLGSITGLFPLMLAGVVIGLCGKIAEIVDEKYDHRPTKAIKNFFSSLFQSTTQPEKEKAGQKTISQPTNNPLNQLYRDRGDQLITTKKNNATPPQNIPPSHKSSSALFYSYPKHIAPEQKNNSAPTRLGFPHG